MKRKSPARKGQTKASVDSKIDMGDSYLQKRKQGRTAKVKASPAYKAKESMAYHGRVREARQKAGGIGKRSAMLRKKPPK